MNESPAYAHFVAGGVAGITGALLTSPLDVIKTRLQSDFYKGRVTVHHGGIISNSTHQFVDTCRMISEIYRVEGTRGLFRGLGPNLVGIVPARSINFFVYGNGKRYIANHFYDGKENSIVHLFAAAMAGIATSTATNPIWLIKTRLQLDRNVLDSSKPRFTSSYECTKHVLRTEGIKGLYKGLTASFLGVSETTIQWVTYEYFKSLIARRQAIRRANGEPENTVWESTFEWAGKLGSAAGAKLCAAGVAYPHEVVRTRLRQSPESGGARYTGLVQCFRLIWKEEGMVALYGGLTAHLMRVVPNAAILFGTYELVMTLLSG